MVESKSEGKNSCHCKHTSHDCKLVVVTGGPGAGKTAVLKMAKQVLCEHITITPEAATIVFGGGFWRKESLPAKKASQRAIFHVQKELENILLEEKLAAVGLCDRGTLDGLAYWPGEEVDFWSEIGSSMEKELEKYAAVIHLRTPGADSGYDLSNPVRIETASQANLIDEKIYKIWEKHPNRTVIDSTSDFFTKALHAVIAIKNVLPTCCQTHDLDELVAKMSNIN